MIPGVIYEVSEKAAATIIKAGAAISLETNGVDDGKRTDETAEAVSTDDQQ